MSDLNIPAEAPRAGDGYSYARGNSGWLNNPTFRNLLVDSDGWAPITINSTVASGFSNAIMSTKDHSARWQIGMGDEFCLYSYNDAGTLNSQYAFKIGRVDNSAWFNGSVHLNPNNTRSTNLTGRDNDPINPDDDLFGIYSSVKCCVFAYSFARSNSFV